MRKTNDNNEYPSQYAEKKDILFLFFLSILHLCIHTHKHKTVIFLEDCFFLFCSIEKEERHKLRQ